MTRSNPTPSPVAVIPAYQAERWIADVVRGTAAQVEKVLVVDDGSTDATAEHARQAGAEVVSHPVNRGKGAALRTAFDHLFQRGVETVVTLDADGQHLPEEIPRLLEAIGDADLVIGARHHLFAQFSRLRRVSNRLSSRAISVLAGRPVSDVQSGFRAYTRGLIEATGFPEDRFEAESAVVVRASRLGMRIAMVPVRLGYPDGRASSHYRPLVDSVRIARAVLRARRDTPR